MKIPYINEILLEYLAYWESGLQASRLAKILGQSREHVQRHVIGPFKQNYPSRFITAGNRMYKLDDTCEGLRFAPYVPSELLRMLDGMTVLYQNEPEAYPFGVKVENPLRGIAPEPNPEIFRALYTACARKRALALQYHSKKQLFPMQFSPHTLVQLPERIHFRGYARWHADRKGLFIDLVPARVISIESELLEEAVSSSTDVDWHTKVQACFVLSPTLPELLSELLRQEWGAYICREDPNRLVIPDVRQAIKPYINRALRYRFFGDTLHEVWLPSSSRSEKS